MIERVEFDELCDDVANLAGMIRDANRQIAAQALLMQIVIHALTERWPPMRDIICSDLNEEISKAERRFALLADSHTPDLIEDHAEEIEVLESLAAKIAMGR